MRNGNRSMAANRILKKPPKNIILGAVKDLFYLLSARNRSRSRLNVTRIASTGCDRIGR